MTLTEVTDDNWRAIADIAPHDHQRDQVAALGARYLLLSLREGVWHSLGVLADDRIVGHVMWAYDPDEGAHWIGGMVVDAAEQGNGVGRAALRLLLRDLAERPGGREVRLSYLPGNTAAHRLYTSLGFVPTDAREGEEVVAVHRF